MYGQTANTGAIAGTVCKIVRNPPSLQQEDQHSDPRNGVTENVDTLRAQGQSSAHRDWANERRGCAPSTDGDDRPSFGTDYSDIVPKALKNRSL